MVTWNTLSITIERFDYCKRMGCDVLAVTELWRCQEKFTSHSHEFTTSVTVKDKDGNLINDNDPAAGVGILLSPRAQGKVLDAGNDDSERICWVRLEGPACNLFITSAVNIWASCLPPDSSRTIPGGGRHRNMGTRPWFQLSRIVGAPQKGQSSSGQLPIILASCRLRRATEPVSSLNISTMDVRFSFVTRDSCT